MIVTDPKGELYRDMSKLLQNEGYEVKIFNLVNPAHSDRWNPLSEVTDDLSAQKFSEIVITNTRTSLKASGDPFWDRAEMNLLKALTLYVTTEFKKDGKATMETLYSLACGSSSEIDKTFKSLPLGHSSKAPYNIYAQANDNVRTGVVIGLGTRLQVFQNKLIQGLTEVNDIDLLLPAKRKCAYFCIMSDTDSTLNFLSSLFFSFLFIDLVNYADSTATGRCEPEVNFLLDEFANIGEIPDFTKKMSTIRSRALNCSIIIQSIPQIQNRYPMNGWQEILGNCDTKLILSCGDNLSAEYISDSLGQATIRVTSHSKHLGIDHVLDFGKETKSVGKRNLLNPDELRQMSDDKCITMLRGQKPLRLYKLDYTEHPKSKNIIQTPYSRYKPKWSEKWLKQDNNSISDNEPLARETTTAKLTPMPTKANLKEEVLKTPKPATQHFKSEKNIEQPRKQETVRLSLNASLNKPKTQQVFYINEEAAIAELEKMAPKGNKEDIDSEPRSVNSPADDISEPDTCETENCNTNDTAIIGMGDMDIEELDPDIIEIEPDDI